MFDGKDTTFYNLPFKMDYEYIKTTEDAFNTFSYFDNFNSIAIDTETTGLDPFLNDVILLQLALPDGKVFVYDLRYIPGELFAVLLEDERFLHILQNANFDYKMMKANYGISISRMYDTMIAERCINLGLLNSSAGLGHLIYKYLNYTVDKDVAVEFTQGEKNAPLTRRQIQYAAHDAMCLFSIVKQQSKVITGQKLNRACKLEFDFISHLADMELTGICLDQDKWREIIKQTDGELKNLVIELMPLLSGGISQQGLFGVPQINLASTPKLLNCLNKLGLELEDTSVASLERVAHKNTAVTPLLKYRKLEKLLSSFGESILEKIHPVTGRLHSRYNQMVSTGRLSCKKPNLQQIPGTSAFRSCFVAKPGYKLITSDMSQAELRIIACYSKDPVFLAAYNSGKDLHTATACGVHGLTEEEVIADKNLPDNDPNKKDYRKNTKCVSFGLCYGMSKYGLAARLKITEEDAEEMIDNYFQAYPGVKRFLDKSAEDAVNRGFSSTISGRRRYYNMPGPEVSADDRKSYLNGIRRRGKNTPIQGSNADIMKQAIINLGNNIKEGGYDAKISLTVHDEVVVEVIKSQAETVAKIVTKSIIDAWEEFFTEVPMVCDTNIGDYWDH